MLALSLSPAKATLLSADGSGTVGRYAGVAHRDVGDRSAVCRSRLRLTRPWCRLPQVVRRWSQEVSSRFLSGP
jgi:hypothetical protein